MRLKFRHGIVSSQPTFLFYNASGNIDILATTKPLTVTIAHKDSNYLHSEDNNVTDAWQGTFDATVDYWLYIEFNPKTFVRTFGYTTEAPTASISPPATPTTDETTWFNTSTNEQYKWIGSTYSSVIRVFVAKLRNQLFYSVSQNNPSFYGTQIGNNTGALAGTILYTNNGNALLKDDKTFLTTETQFFTNQSYAIGVRLESNVMTAISKDQSLSAHQIVSIDIDGYITSADYADSETNILAVLTNDVLIGEVGNVILQGVVHNTDWDFSSYSAGTKLWVLDGEFTNVDPHVSDPATYQNKQNPIARVLSSDSVIFMVQV